MQDARLASQNSTVCAVSRIERERSYVEKGVAVKEKVLHSEHSSTAETSAETLLKSVSHVIVHTVANDVMQCSPDLNFSSCILRHTQAIEPDILSQEEHLD